MPARLSPAEVLDIKVRLAELHSELWRLTMSLRHSDKLIECGERAFGESRALLRRIGEDDSRPHEPA